MIEIKFTVQSYSEAARVFEALSKIAPNGVQSTAVVDTPIEQSVPEKPANPTPSPAKKQTLAQEAFKKQTDPKPEQVPSTASDVTYTLEDVRAETRKRQDTKRAELKQILVDHGAESTGTLDPSKYASVIEAIKALDNE